MDTQNKSLTVQEYVKKPDVQKRINELLKERAGDFVISLSSITSQNELLAKCEPKSLVMGALTATAMGLPINPNLGFCFLIPYKQKDGSYVAQLQLGYKAFVQLAMRSKQFKKINVTDVREGEMKGHDRLTGDIEFNWIESHRNAIPVIGYVAYFSLNNGFSKSLYMTKEEINAHGQKYSQTAKRGFGLWKDEFDAMASKTVLKLLISKYAPLTTEMQKAQLVDQAVIEGEDEFKYIDNSVTKPDVATVSADKEEARIKEFIKNCKNSTDLEDNCKDYVEKLDKENPIKKLYISKLDELKLK